MLLARKARVWIGGIKRLSSTARMGVLDRVFAHPSNSTAIIHSHSKFAASVQLTYSYEDLRSKIAAFSHHLSTKLNPSTRPIASLLPSSMEYCATMLGAWHRNCAFVPLSTQHTHEELTYFVSDTNPQCIVTSPQFDAIIQPIAKKLGIPVVNVDDALADLGHNAESVWPASANDAALIVYTSGTTGRPKGVVHTHKTVDHMTRSLIQAWEWSPHDHILHFLPLHHVHGIVNKLLCPLYTGATVEFVPADPLGLWERLAGKSDVTLFMAVPTIYSRMLEAVTHEKVPAAVKEKALENIRDFRLMVSGSAAMPDSLMHKWESLTSHRLLERYGMTEIGMALGNPLHGERLPGFVGRPLPYVQVRVVDENEREAGPGEQGELRVKGHTVFREYLNKPDATAKEFDEHGWFKTGDIAVYDANKDSYKILGRASVDIIKSAGYKISALEIEREILTNSKVAEVAVVGKDDETWGQVILAIVRLFHKTDQFDLKELQQHLKDRLAPYKHPRAVHVVDQIPRNHLGKVNKRTLLSDLGL